MPMTLRRSRRTRPQECDPHRPFDRRRRGGALCGAPRREPRRQGSADQRRTTPHGQNARQSGRASQGSVRRVSGAGRHEPGAVLLRRTGGPFYGFNRPGAKVSAGIIQNWWRQGMMGGAKAHYDGIVAFSQTDYQGPKEIAVPTLVMHGDDDQIVPYADSGPLCAKLVKRRAEDLQGVPARHADDQCGNYQRRSAGVRPELIARISGAPRLWRAASFGGERLPERTSCTRSQNGIVCAMPSNKEN